MHIPFYSFITLLMRIVLEAVSLKHITEVGINIVSMAEMASFDQNKSNQDDANRSAGSYRLFPSVRLFMITISFLGMSACVAGYTTLSFALVCMVKGANETGNCSKMDNENGNGGQFDWDRPEQSNLLAAYAWGATLAALPAGWLSDKLGGKWVFLICLIVHTVTSALTPWSAFRGYYWIFTIRILVGMAAGGSIPCLTSVASRWAPEKERTLLTTVTLNGTNMGPLLAVALSGIMCQTAIGWPLIFYTWSAVSAAMAIVWYFFYTDDPQKCRFISANELQMLTENRKHSSDMENGKSNLKTPWRHILFSRTTWAIFLCHFCVNWSVGFIDEFVPTYSKEILKLTVSTNGIYSALPFICKFLSTFLFGIMAEKLTCRSFSKNISVKSFNTLAMGVPAVCMLVLSFLKENTPAEIAILLFSSCAFFYLAVFAGVFRSIILVAPQFCGTISSVSHVFGYGSMIGMPYVVGIITKQGTVEEWRIAFYITLALSAFGCVQFLVFGSGEEQKWSKLRSEENDDYVKKAGNFEI